MNRNKKYILFVYKPNPSGINGFFDEEDNNIYINGKKSKLERDLIFVHENQHKECFNTKCKCWRTVFWSEYHAFRAELHFVLKVNKRKYWHEFFRVAIRSLIKHMKHLEIQGWLEHYKALRKVLKLNECVKYAKEYGYWKQIKGLLK